jgi:hypothetical protein
VSRARWAADRVSSARSPRPASPRLHADAIPARRAARSARRASTARWSAAWRFPKHSAKQNDGHCGTPLDHGLAPAQLVASRLHGRLHVEHTLQGVCQIERFALAPVVQEQVAGLLVAHVLDCTGSATRPSLGCDNADSNLTVSRDTPGVDHAGFLHRHYGVPPSGALSSREK